MSNRTLAFLLLLAICTGLLGFVYYYFIANVGSFLVDVGDGENIKVTFSGEFQNNYDNTCTKKCIFKGMPPVNYNVTATKDGYRDFAGEFKLDRGKTKIIRIILKKNVELVENVKSKDDKIIEIKYKKYQESLSQDESYSKRVIFGIYSNMLYSYSTANGFKIYSYDGETEEVDFSQDEVKIGTIGFNSFDGIINYTIGNDNFIYDLSTKTSYRLNINEKITLVKKSGIDDKYIVLTDNGVFLYSANTNDYIKNTLFDDIIILGNNKILGLIKKDSKSKLSILNFQDNGKNKLVIHDLTTRERKIIHEIDGDVKNIIEFNGGVNYTDSNNKIYSLKELDLN